MNPQLSFSEKPDSPESPFTRFSISCFEMCIRDSYTEKEGAAGSKNSCWTRVIWDVTAVAWLLDGDFMRDRLVPSPIPQYDHHYSFDPGRHFIRYVYHINRDNLFEDLFRKLAQ